MKTGIPRSLAALVFALGLLGASPPTEPLPPSGAAPARSPEPPAITAPPNAAPANSAREGAPPQQRALPAESRSLWTDAQQLQPTIIAALIAFAGAILVAALTQLVAACLQSRSLRYAAKEKRAEELRDFRRTILLEAIDALAGLSTHLGSFGLMDGTEASREDAARRGGALAKVQLVVSGETLRVFHHANQLYGRATFELTAIRGKIAAAEMQLAKIRPPSSLLSRIGLLSSQERTRANQISIELQQLRFNLLSVTMDRVIELGEAILHVQIAFRRELEVPDESAALIAESSRSQEMLKEQKRLFVESIQPGIKAGRSGIAPSLLAGQETGRGDGTNSTKFMPEA